MVRIGKMEWVQWWKWIGNAWWNVDKNDTVFTYKMLTYVDVFEFAHVPIDRNHCCRWQRPFHRPKKAYALDRMKYSSYLMHATNLRGAALGPAFKYSTCIDLFVYFVFHFDCFVTNKYERAHLQCHQDLVRHSSYSPNNIMSWSTFRLLREAIFYGISRTFGNKCNEHTSNYTLWLNLIIFCGFFAGNLERSQPKWKFIENSAYQWNKIEYHEINMWHPHYLLPYIQFNDPLNC